MTKTTRVLIGVALAIGLGGALTGLSILRAYDKATHIDRTVAKVVVRQYVDAALVDRDDQRAALYLCKSPGDLAIVATMRRDLEAREATNGYATQVVISSSIESGGGSIVEVEMQLNQGSGTDVRTRVKKVRFHLAEEDGWRVCSAEQLPDPTPSTSPSATPPTAS